MTTNYSVVLGGLLRNNENISPKFDSPLQIDHLFVGGTLCSVVAMFFAFEKAQTRRY